MEIAWTGNLHSHQGFCFYHSWSGKSDDGGCKYHKRRHHIMIAIKSPKGCFLSAIFLPRYYGKVAAGAVIKNRLSVCNLKVCVSAGNGRLFLVLRNRSRWQREITCHESHVHDRRATTRLRHTSPGNFLVSSCPDLFWPRYCTTTRYVPQLVSFCMKRNVS